MQIISGNEQRVKDQRSPGKSQECEFTVSICCSTESNVVPFLTLQGNSHNNIIIISNDCFRHDVICYLSNCIWPE